MQPEAKVLPTTLEMRGITKTYAGVVALSDVSVEIRPGEVHAILGENGAGKSTLMNIATGRHRSRLRRGARSRGGPSPRCSPKAAADLGIAIVHQHPAVLPDMTVLENLQVALPARLFADGTGAAARPHARAGRARGRPRATGSSR